MTICGNVGKKWYHLFSLDKNSKIFKNISVVLVHMIFAADTAVTKILTAGELATVTECRLCKMNGILVQSVA